MRFRLKREKTRFFLTTFDHLSQNRVTYSQLYIINTSLTALCKSMFSCGQIFSNI